MAYNCKNYKTDGGDRTVIGGTLEVNGKISGNIVSNKIDALTASTATAEQCATTINSIIAALKKAGIIKSS